MTATTKTMVELDSALVAGYRILAVTGTATIWLLLMDPPGEEAVKAWTVTP